jgi:hypothetical protein
MTSSLRDLAIQRSIDLGSTALPAASSAVRSSVDDLLRLARGAGTSYNPALTVQETVEQVVKKPNAFLDQFLGPLGSNLAKGAAVGVPTVAGLAVLPSVLKGLAPLYGLGGKEGDKQSGGQSGGQGGDTTVSPYQAATLGLVKEQLALERQRAASADAAQQATIGAQSDQAKLLADYLTKSLDPELFRQRQEAQTQAKIAEARVFGEGAMDRTREVTRREVEKQTISAWQGITQAEINRDTAMGLGMMSLAYGTALPNPQVMQAAASMVQQGAAGFKPQKSII